MSRSFRIFFIRHGETVDNVASIYAGVRDSALTVHGVNQASRLATHLVTERGLIFDRIWSSDLQRARNTAQKIADTQNALPCLNQTDQTPTATLNEDQSAREQIEVIQLPVLRELDFGSLEGKKFGDKMALKNREELPSDFIPQETKDSMRERMQRFRNTELVPYILSFETSSTSCDASEDAETVNIAIVSHGMVLSHLWGSFVCLTAMRRISFGRGVDQSTFPMRWTYDRLGGWSNTGFYEAFLSPVPTTATTKEEEFNFKSMEEGPLAQVLDCIPLHKYMLRIEAVNYKDHLMGLKRQRGGVGSSAADGKQQGLESFFKKAKKD